MKIGTITTHMADNFGAVLQAYALSTYVGKYVPCEIINYYPDYANESYNLKRKIRSLKAIIYRAYDLLHIDERKRRKEKFVAFRENYMRLSPECHTSDELRELSSQYQAIITGSDQVWNPGLHRFDENYFLTFCQDKVRKYGYAPSFGVAELKEKQKKIVKIRCEGFSNIAFREKSGVQIARDLFEKDFQLVLDPVFLINKEEWIKLLPDVAPQKPYYLCYYLSDPRESVKYVCNLGKRNGAEVISIGYSIKDFMNGAKKIYDLGPLEFLSYLCHAECVFTDSFHATAFSIIFNRPFYTRVDGKNAKRSDRVVTLIESLKLGNRAYAEKDLNIISASPIDYKEADELLQGFIEESKEYVGSIIMDSAHEKKIDYSVLKGLKAYSGYILDKQMLKKSSSGGFAAGMAQHVLHAGGVVYGVAYTDDYKGVTYKRIDDVAELMELVGSKYIKSSGVTKNLIQSVENDLLQKRKVLFFGLPCEIVALTIGLERGKKVRLDNLLTVDLICHGPTYPKVQEEYINGLEKKYGGKVNQFSVRYKFPNWVPSHVYALFDNGKEMIREFGYTDFGEAFRKMPMKSCLNCKFKGNRHKADITIGDYWGIPKPSESYNKTGVSIALVRTQKGDEFLNSIEGISLFTADARFIIEHNLNYAFPVEKPIDYDAFREDFEVYGLHGACKKHYSDKMKLLMRTPQCILHMLRNIRGR